MSHTTNIDEIVFSDTAALKLAVKDLAATGIKAELVENTVPRMYYSDQLPKAPFVLKLADSKYDVGFYYDKAKKGYVAKTDFHAGYVESILGATARKDEKVSAGQRQMGKLFAAYAINAATLQAQKQGYSVRRIPQQDGGVQLIMTGMRG